MANEIAIAWLTGKTLTANVFQPDGSDRETAINLVENVTGTLYLGDCATIKPGDIIIAYEAGVVLGQVEYDPMIVEGVLTRVEIQRLLLAVLAGLSTGGGSDTLSFRDVADSKDRVVATVDKTGNRTVIVLDGA